MSAPTPRLSYCAIAVASSVALLGSSALAGGRPGETERNWYPEFSGGWAFAQGDTDDVLDDDFTISGGAECGHSRARSLHARPRPRKVT